MRIQQQLPINDFAIPQYKTAPSTHLPKNISMKKMFTHSVEKAEVSKLEAKTNKCLLKKSLVIYYVNVFVLFLISASAFGQATSNTIGFEAGNVTGWLFTGGTADANNFVSLGSGAANVRTGTYSLGVTVASTSTRYAENTSFNVVTNATQTYTHAIIWAKASTGTTMQANPRLTRAGSSSNGTLANINNTTWTRVTNSWNQASQTVYPGLRKGTLAGTAYFDDVVIYTGASATADILSPNAPSAVSGSYSGTNALLNWTSGGDNTATGTTGVQATLVLQYTGSGTPTAPTLNNQANYAVNDIPATDWKVVKIDGAAAGSSVDVGAIAADSRYVLYHRDLAYNWSAASSLITVSVGGGGCANPPTATAGSTINVCQSSSPVAIVLTGASIGGGASTGTWSITTAGGGGTLSSTSAENGTNVPLVTYTPNANATGTVVLTLTTDAGGAGCVAASSTRTINVNAGPTAVAGTTINSCTNIGSAVTIGTGASNTNSTVAWTVSGTLGGGTGTVGSPTNVTGATYTPSATDITNGPSGNITLTLTATGTLAGCTAVTAVSTKSFIINSAPSANAGGSDAICQSATPSAFTLNGATINSPATTGTWSITTAGGGGILSSTTAQTGSAAVSAVTYTPTANATGIVVLTLTTNATTGCAAATSTRTISVNAAPTASAGSAIISCSNTAGAVTIGTGATSANSTILWTASGAGPIGNGTDLNGATYTPDGTDITNGNVTLTLTATGTLPGCTSITAESNKLLTINAAPTASFTSATGTTLFNTPFVVNDASATNFSSLSWSHDGQGTLTNTSGLTPTYTPGGADGGNSVTLSLVANGNAGCSPSAAATKVLSITLPADFISTAAISGSPICAGSTVSVGFTSSGTYSSNTFTAELSDASGGWGSPVALSGSLALDGTDPSGSFNVTIPSNTISGSQYKIRVVSSSPTVVGSNNGVFTISAQPNAGTVSADQTICANTAAASVSVTGSVGDLQWQSSTTSSTSGYSNISGANSDSYNPGVITQTTYFQLVASAAGCASSATSAPITVTVNSSPNEATGAVSGSTCGAGTVNLSVDDPGGDLVVDWFSLAAGGSSLFTGVTYSPSIATTTIYYAEIRNTITGCKSATRLGVTGTVNTQPAITTNPNTGFFNYDLNASATALTVAATGTGITYQWRRSNDAVNNTSADDINVGTSANSYTPSTTTVGTFYYYCTVTAPGCTVVTSAVSGAITVNSIPDAFMGYKYITATTGTVPLAWSTTATTFNAGTGKEIAFSNLNGSISAATVAGTSSVSQYSLAGSNQYVQMDLSTANSSNATFTIQLTGSSNNSSVATAGIAFSSTIPFSLSNCIGAVASSDFPASSGALAIWNKVNITPPAGTKSVRIYRRIFYNSTTGVASESSGTGFVQFGAGSTIRLASMAAYIVTPGCPAPTVSNPSTSPQSPCINTSATPLSVTASGTGTLSYQWQSSTASNFSANVQSVGTNSDSYTPQTTVAGTLYYRCIVTNNCGTNTSTATSGISGAVNVLEAPAISSQSTAGATYPEGFASPIALSVSATGPGLTYQWYSSTDNVTNTVGDDVALGTSSAETPSTAVQGTLYYYCVVSGTCAPAATSAISGAIIIGPVCTAPTFSVDPTNQSECVGGTSTLGTVVADQSPTYQWYSNTTLSNIGGTSVGASNGGTTDTYTPTSTTPGIYYYYVVATSGACTTASIPVQLTVNATAIASQSTAGATYSQNATASALTVTAAAYSDGLSYQWYSSTDAATNTNGDDVAVGTNSNTYTPLTTSLGTLYYYCVVSGNCTPSSATSAISGAINVVSYVTGDYVSKASGSWESIATWSVWNGSTLVNATVIPNSTTASVYIAGGFNVTYPTSDRNCNNLYVLNGSLSTGTVINGANRRYIFVNGNTVEVGPNGTLGSALTGDNADAICIDTKLTSGPVTFTGSGGLANFGLIRYSNTPEIIIDRDITLNYHGSAFAGNAMAYFGNGTITQDNTLTVNAGKTLTFAPWACYSASGTSGNLAAVNLIVQVNGTLTMQPWAVPYTAPRGYMSGGVAAGKFFYLGVGNTGTVNLQELWPNGTNGTGDPVYIEVAAGGVVKVANVTDLRNTNNLIYGDGEFNVQSGATLRLRDLAGITLAPSATGAIQTGVRTFSTAANYTYEAIAGAQVTGDALPASVNNLTINNSNGVTLTNSVSVNGILALTSGKLTTDVNTVSVTTAGAGQLTGSSATNYVDGSLTRAIASGASSVVFPVGDATTYAPLSLAFGAGNTAGSITANTSATGVPPTAGLIPGGSGLSQTNYINRKWSLSNSTIASPDYAATFTYNNPADVVGGANTNSLLIGQDNAGIWSSPGVASSVSPTVTSVTGLTSFGDFYLGENGCENVALATASATASPICTDATTTLTYTGLTGTNASVTWYDGMGGTGNSYGSGTPSTAVGPGTYYAFATGTCGTAVEIQVIVGANATTSISTNAAPSSQTVYINSLPTNLTITATGVSLSYQWYSNNSNSNTGGTSVGVSNGGQTDTYTPPSNTLGTNYYYCVVTGTCGTVSSSAVEVTVNNTNTWKVSPTDNVWSNPNNWTAGIAPNSTTDAVIPGNAVIFPVLSAPAAINDLNINTGANVNINDNTLTITGSVTGLGTLTGSATSNVVTGPTNTTLRFTQTNAVTRSLKSITVSAGTTTLANTLEITAGTAPASASAGVVTVANGAILDANGFLVLNSNQFGTARIAPSTSTSPYITGDVTVERYIPANTLRAWRLLAVPTKGTQTIKQSWQEGQAQLANGTPGYGTIITANISSSAALLGAGFDAFTTSPAMQRYGTGAWVNVTNTNVAIESDKAYFLYIRGSRAITPSIATSAVDATTLRTTGTLYQGPVTVNTAGSFTPIANVYASAVDFTQLTRSGVSNTYYLWDAKKASGVILGAYQTFSGTAGFQCIPGGGSFTPNQVNTTIQSGQGFFVAGTGSVTFNESAKVSGSSLSGYRPAMPVSALVKIDSRLYNSSNTLVDANVVVFNNNYENAVDADDAVKYTNPAENFGIVTNNTHLVVEGRKPITADDVINFNVSNLKEQTYTLEFTAANMSNSNLEAQLVDKYLGTSTPVDITGVTKVSFTVDANAGSKAADRFSLVFKVKPTVPSITKAGIVVSPNPVEGSSMNLQFANQAVGKYTVRILNLQGKAITTAVINHAGGSSNQVINLSSKVAAGMYKVEIIGADKTRTVQTVFVK